jgi:hypothetical protein
VSDQTPSIRKEYERRGADQFYRESGAKYRNPHEAELIAALDQALKRWSPDTTHVLDLAAGSGEIAMGLRSRDATQIHGIDPYTFQAYEARTGQIAERLTFDDIVDGALAGRRYSLIVCSFAMHLCERSKLPALCLQLSLIAPRLLILTPHKRPVIREEWGWTLVGEFVEQRVRARFYHSKITDSASD